MTQQEQHQRELIHGEFGLLSEKCECGRRKISRQSFCRACYKVLPEHLKKALYNRIGEGYEEAHASARSWLKGD